MLDLITKNLITNIRGNPISEQEEKILSDLSTIYKQNYLAMAIVFSKKGKIKEITRNLVQMCGYRENIPKSLSNVIKDIEWARYNLSEEVLQVVMRLQKVTQQGEISVVQIFYAKVGRYPNKDEIAKLVQLQRRFGKDVLVYSITSIRAKDFSLDALQRHLFNAYASNKEGKIPDFNKYYDGFDFRSYYRDDSEVLYSQEYQEFLGEIADENRDYQDSLDRSREEGWFYED